MEAVDPSPRHETILRLFREGRPLESIMSGWRLSEGSLCELLLQAHRAGEKIDPRWLLPARSDLADRILDTIKEHEELDPVRISSLFKGRISPAVVRVLRIITGGGGADTRIFDESTFFETLHDDLMGAESEILIVAPEVKSHHWRHYLEPTRRLAARDGVTAIFADRVSDLVRDGLADAEIAVIEQKTHANLILIDARIVWEGSMNFLLPPAGAEHVRRTVSRIQCDEIRAVHDLYV